MSPSASSPNSRSPREEPTESSAKRRRLVARVTFAALYLAVQVTVIAAAQCSPDHVFGFQMFSEASRIEIRLFREVERDGAIRLLAVNKSGRFRARDESGKTHAFAWKDRVRDSTLSRLNTKVTASYGFDAQLFRLQAALEDMAEHLEGDSETRALVAEVRGSRNGKAVPVTRLTARRKLSETQSGP